MRIMTVEAFRSLNILVFLILIDICRLVAVEAKLLGFLSQEVRIFRLMGIVAGGAISPGYRPVQKGVFLAIIVVAAVAKLGHGLLQSIAKGLGMAGGAVSFPIRLVQISNR